jgi:two-component system nitrate/nitrite response regulator NarL
MGDQIATIIIEPRQLVREALVSLMASQSYLVVGKLASTADIDHSFHGPDAPKLVILGAFPAVEATTAASRIRRLWPKTKVVLLFEHASPADLQRLLASDIDGCIPLFTSADTLIGMLQQIIAADLRILVPSTEARSSVPCTTSGARDELDLGSHNLVPSNEVANGATDMASAVHHISKREEQILGALVKGHPNKRIARTCGITEATIKVHMKSILKKIGVANRTQAAVWARDNGTAQTA